MINLNGEYKVCVTGDFKRESDTPSFEVLQEDVKELSEIIQGILREVLTDDFHIEVETVLSEVTEN
jgi:hypothetical protein